MGGLVGEPIRLNLSEAKKNLSIVFHSFGVKSGQEFPKADLYLDCRGVAEPSGAGLSGTGDNPDVQDWVNLNSNLSPYFDMVIGGISRLSTRRGVGKEYEKPFTVVTMCAHGIHRSRAVKHILAKTLRGTGWGMVEVK